MNALNVDMGVPLCVDLDGTLVASDTLHESLLALVRRQPWTLLLLPLWVLQGKAHFKQQLSARIALPASRLPYRSEVVDYLTREKVGGRTLVLATAANKGLAKAIAEHLGLFDRVLASDAWLNLKGARKADALVSEYGKRGFDYMGDSTADLAVWSAARRALVVGSTRLVQRAGQVAAVEKVFPHPSRRLKDWAKAMRIHQWVKNALVFVPLLAAHKFAQMDLMLQSVLAFVAFSLCASSVYIINDLVDLESDRAHPRKSSRPFASGRLSIAGGIVTAPLLLLGAFLVSALLPAAFVGVLASYFVATLLYSLRLKRTTVLDVLLLAGLYTVRLIAGAAAVSLKPSFWLLAFSMFLFLSLALVKRVAELRALPIEAGGRPGGRNYSREDLPVLTALGTASGYTCVMVFALYINSSTSELLYRRPEALWLLCPLLLFWISRVWLVTHRGQMHDDPIVFAFRDSVSRWLVIPTALTLWLAI